MPPGLQVALGSGLRSRSRCEVVRFLRQRVPGTEAVRAPTDSGSTPAGKRSQASQRSKHGFRALDSGAGPTAEDSTSLEIHFPPQFPPWEKAGRKNRGSCQALNESK